MVIRHPLVVILLFSVGTAWGQQVANEPHVGYLYPAGGQRGSVVQITVGGQFLRGAAEVHICGEGVRGSVIQYMPQLRNISGEQRQLLQSRLKELREKWLAELSENGPHRVAGRVEGVPPSTRLSPSSCPWY
jgi:hypothetical protein